MNDINKKYTGIIPAAGLSSRMKEWKPGIIIAGLPLICHAVKTLFPFSCSIIIVGGYNFPKLESVIHSYLPSLFYGNSNNLLVENKNYEKGMFSSVRSAACLIDENVDGIFLLPGDIPFVHSSTINSLIAEFERGEAPVVIPAVKEQNENTSGQPVLRKGHPVLFNNNVLAEIKKSSDDGSMRDVLSSKKIKIIETMDQGICFDLDSESDLQHIESCLIQKRNRIF